jgi:hypothetical protein
MEVVGARDVCKTLIVSPVTHFTDEETETQRYQITYRIGSGKSTTQHSRPLQLKKPKMSHHFLDLITA